MGILKLNLRNLLLISLLAGLIQVIVGITLYLSGNYFASWSAIVNILFLALCIIVGPVWYRKNILNNIASYFQILLIGLTISIVVGLIYAIYNIISINFFYPNFLSDMINAGAEMLKNKGLDQIEIEKAIDTMKVKYTIQSIALMNFAFLSITGIVSTLIFSIFLKKK